MSYPQEWAAYNRAQTHEHERFLPLLRELCDGIEQPPQALGRPRLPLSDVVFALGVKTYSGLSGHRATSVIRDAAAQGLMDAAPSYNTAFRYLESPETTDVLKALIEESARPLAAVEDDFAIDSTGIGTTTYRRWFDHKWGRERSTQTWVKVHAMTGVKTNVVTAIEATATESADSPQLPKLLARTAETFDVQEVSADRAYSSKRNLRAVHDLGATPYVPFKKGQHRRRHTPPVRRAVVEDVALLPIPARGVPDPLPQAVRTPRRRSRWSRRSSAGSVRAKAPTAQVNEALLKFLCHNIVVLIQSIYELDLEPVFWEPTDCPESPPDAGF